MNAGTRTGDAPAWTPRGRRFRSLDRRQRALAIALALAAGGIFLLAAVQARADDWYPTGDNGTMLTVTRQVFTANTPLTGEVASGTRYGAHPFHPGPMVYYVLAPFEAVFGGTVGLLLGAAFVSTASVVLIGYTALRTAGPLVALWAWITTLAMCWSLGGTAFLYPPFKTTLALLVILLFLHLSAALVSGRSTLLPLWVLAASFPVAATMRYALPVLAIAFVTALLVAGLRWRRLAAGAEPPRSWRERATAFATLAPTEGRSLLLAAAIAVVCWWGPAYEALTNGGGNVRELYRASRTAAGAVDGPTQAVAEQAKALLFDPVQSAADFTSPSAVYVVVSVLLLTAIGVLVFRQRRAIGRLGWAFVSIAASALVFMVASLATTPSDEGFGIYRTLASSPVGAFVVFTGGLVVALVVLPRRTEATTTVVTRVAAGAVLVGAVLVALPGPIDASTEQYPFAYRATRTMVDQAAPQLASPEGRWGALLVGGRTTATIFTGFKAGLEAAGVDTGIDARAPGLDEGVDDTPPPFVGDLLFMASDLPDPTGDWEVIATYEPPGRSAEEAERSAQALVDFARETEPRPLDAFVQTLPRILCPDAVVAAGGGPADCPAATQALAQDNPVANLPAPVVALAYLVQFGDDTQFPVLDGEKPPQELLDAAAASWDDIPLTAYALRRTGAGS